MCWQMPPARADKEVTVPDHSTSQGCERRKLLTPASKNPGDG